MTRIVHGHVYTVKPMGELVPSVFVTSLTCVSGNAYRRVFSELKGYVNPYLRKYDIALRFTQTKENIALD